MAAAVGLNQLVRLLDGWADDGGALHIRLTDRLRQLVHSGNLPSGTRLPSERSLASALSVSRNTVSTAFDELRGEGVFASRQGDGTYVTSARRHNGARGDDRLYSFMSRPGPPNGHQIDLRSAALPGLSLVADEVDRIRGEDIHQLVLTHGYLPAGLPELRAEVANYYAGLGLPTVPDQILITSGAQQAMRLIAASLLEPGATVLVEEPSFRGAIELFRAAGARLVPVPSGPDGIDVRALGRAARAYRPVLILVQSTVHNPTGSVMDSAKRRAVAVLAASLGIPVLDDATPLDTLIDQKPRTPVAAFGGPVITVGSVSKSFWGGLRVGWLRADPATVHALAAIKGGEDLGTSLLAQVVAARLLPRIETARDERRVTLGAAREKVLDALSLLLPDWEPQVPAGGASLWVRLPHPCATALAERAERAGVRLLPGPTFSCVDGLDDHLRIGFAATTDIVLTGLRRLAAAWRSWPEPVQ